MNKINYVFILFVWLCFSPQVAQKNEPKWTKPDLTGHWKLFDTKIVQDLPFIHLQVPISDTLNMVSEDSPWDHYTRYDLVFEKDTMYKVHYPIQAFEPHKFSLDSGYLKLEGRNNVYASPIQFVRDTLLLYTPVSTEPGYFKETYVRTNFEDSVLNRLKKYGINYPALAGTWYIIREEDYDYGTHYELNFRHTIPDSIEFSREQMIAALHQPKIYWMRTDGVKRDYIFWYQDSRIYLKPGKWYKKDDEIQIRLYQK